jgi:DNA-directed RNA polymerase II subunit RPB2
MDKETYKYCWKLVQKIFQEETFIKSQLDSYNYFLFEGINSILTSNKINYENYTISFYSPFIDKPYFINEKLNIKSYMYPNQARLRNLSYSAELYCDVDVYDNVNAVTNTLTKIHIATVPIMVLSQGCNLYNCPDIRKFDECEYDQGGYFIIEGKERVLVSQDRLNFNSIYVFKSKPPSRNLYYCEIRSVSPTKSIILNIGIKPNLCEIELEISNYVSAPIPVGIFLKALGIIDVDEITFIVTGGDKALYPFASTVLFESMWIRTQEEAIKWLSEKFQKISIQYVFSTLLFPHLHSKASEIQAVFIGIMCQKLFQVCVGSRKVDNKDSYVNKRADLPGILLNDLFYNLFRKFLNNILKMLQKKENKELDLDTLPKKLKTLFSKKIKNITKGLRYSLATGNWCVFMPNNTKINTKVGVSQILNRLNYVSYLSHINRLTAPVGKEGKLEALRQIHNSQWKIIDPNETPEGAACGVVKNTTIICRSTIYTSDRVVINAVSGLVNFTSTIDRSVFSVDKILIYLNGSIIGYTQDKYRFVKDVKELRKNNILHYQTSIGFKSNQSEIHILTDGGRLTVPHLIVKDGKVRLYDEKIDLESVSIAELYAKNYIQFVDSLEDESSLVATFPTEVNEQTDYCQIHPSLAFGICSSLIIFPNCNQGPRNCYQASMSKQAIGVYSTNYNQRMDNSEHILHYPQKSIVTTQTSKLLNQDILASGQMPIVAILCYSGYNQEDSVIINKSAIERGLFSSYEFSTYYSEEKQRDDDKKEIIGIPIEKIRFKNGNYSKLNPDTGIVRIRTTVQEGDVIIGKYIVSSGNVLIDESIILKHGEEGVVDKVFIDTTSSGYKIVKIKIRSLRIPIIGDKFSSRQSNKVTAGMIYSQEDMPFTNNGICPDLIVNPHSQPSRMVVSMILECLISKTTSISGDYFDGTAFTSDLKDMQKKCEELLIKNGYNRYGEEEMYNGFTGEVMQGNIFIGPIFYQRLKHLVVNKAHVRPRGKVQLMTKQPVEGRAKAGGLRTGEMERDALISHGTANFLKDRLFDCSDAYTIDVCPKCGRMPNSKICEDCETNTRNVRFPYAGKLLFQELMAMGILPRIFPE